VNIKLVQSIPKQAGYYLVRFGKHGGLHLVLIQIQLDGKKVIIPDVCPFKNLRDKKALKCLPKAVELYFNEFPTEAWWSEEPIYSV